MLFCCLHIVAYYEMSFQLLYYVKHFRYLTAERGFEGCSLVQLCLDAADAVIKTFGIAVLLYYMLHMIM
jgi:hypothetical protein